MEKLLNVANSRCATLIGNWAL